MRKAADAPDAPDGDAPAGGDVAAAFGSLPPAAPDGDATGLPDVDDINASLDRAPRADPVAASAGDDASGGGGFAAGFLSVFLLAALLIALYAAAPALARAVPALEDPAAGYVDAVNALRGALETMASALKGIAGD